MTSAPLSVVIPVHNSRAFVGQALASVASQRLPPERVIVVDDGSVDDTGEIVRQWAAVLPIELIALPENRGAGNARRVGVSAATTPLVALLDSDDVWLPDHLAVLVDLHAQRGGVVTANALRWVPGEALATVGTAQRRPVPTHRQLEALLVMNFVFVGSLFAVEDYVRVGGFRSMEPTEDWDLWVRMAAAGSQISSATVPTVLYRVRADGVTGDDNLLEGEIRVLESFLQGERDAERRRAAQHALKQRLARRALKSSYQAGRAERSWRARRLAFGALPGPVGVKLRALGMIAAPVQTVRRRDAAQSDPHHLTRR